MTTGYQMSIGCESYVICSLLIFVETRLFDILQSSQQWLCFRLGQIPAMTRHSLVYR